MKINPFKITQGCSFKILLQQSTQTSAIIEFKRKLYLYKKIARK